MIHKVLVVDDSPIFIMTIQKVIEITKFSAHSPVAKNGLEALQKLKEDEQLPNLIVLDLNMPVMNGWEFLDTVQQLPHLKAIPVIIISSSVDPEDIAKSKTYTNVIDYIYKPFNVSTITHILQMPYYARLTS